MAGTSLPTIGTAWNEYKSKRLRFYEYRYGATLTEKATLAVGFALLTGVAAQLRFYLPFTPVPITLQTFAVIVAGVALGARWGGASQALYAVLGAAGVPWFAGLSGGLGSIFGPTGGYIVGFVFAAVFIGYITDRYRLARRFPALVGLLFVANFLVIYGIGLPWLFGWLTIINGATPTLMDLLTMGLIPFIAGDIVKVLGAATIATVILPSHSFGPEQREN